MFPNPQDPLPLRRRPNVERYRKLAKDLVEACKAFKAGDANAIGAWTEKWIEALVRAQAPLEHTKRLRRQIDRWVKQVEEFATREVGADGTRCRLSEAQFVIAASHGFDSWPTFVRHLNAVRDKRSSTARFEAGVEAIISGDIKTLKRLLRQDGELVRLRSTRNHRATLLHYVSANGVEGYRQKTPKNAVEVAKLLLEAGAEVNAEADVYGGGATTLGLVSTSVHPYCAGVQNPLMQVLIDYGADIDHGPSGDKTSAVQACLDNGRGEAAVYLAERGARLNLEAAAGVGRLDIVEKAFDQNGSSKAGVSRKKLEIAFAYACQFGRNNVVEYMLKKDLSLTKNHGDRQTPLHCAAIGGQLETIKLLLKFKPPLEAVNMYGGTVLGQTLWSAAHGGDPEVYSEIIETLIAAGAKVPERHVPVNERIDDLLRRYGSVPEPTWYWFGEKPTRPKE